MVTTVYIADDSYSGVAHTTHEAAAREELLTAFARGAGFDLHTMQRDKFIAQVDTALSAGWVLTPPPVATHRG